jgi:hypothetical protein
LWCTTTRIPITSAVLNNSENDDLILLPLGEGSNEK